MITTRIVGLSAAALAFIGVFVSVPIVTSAESTATATSPGRAMTPPSSSHVAARSDSAAGTGGMRANGTPVQAAPGVAGGTATDATEARKTTSQLARDQVDAIVNGDAQTTASPPGGNASVQQTPPVGPALPPVPNNTPSALPPNDSPALPSDTALPPPEPPSPLEAVTDRLTGAIGGIIH